MKLALAALALCILAVQPAASAPGPLVAARSGDLSLSLAYDGVLLVKVLDLRIDQKIGADDFTAAARLKTSGVLWLFKRVNVTANAVGRLEGQSPRPAAFDHVNADGEENRQVRVRWAANDVATVAAPAYPGPGDPEPTPAQKAAAADPLTQLTRLALAEPGKGPCGRTLRFFDGRQLYQVAFGPASPRTAGKRELALGLSSPISCGLTYTEVAGFDPARQKNQGLAKPLKAEFASAGPQGPWVITALRGPTPLGEARIELKSLTAS